MLHLHAGVIYIEHYVDCHVKSVYIICSACTGMPMILAPVAVSVRLAVKYLNDICE